MKSYTDDKPLKVGLVGCGQHMSEVLFPMLKLQPEIEITHIASQSGTSAQIFAKKWRIQNHSDSWLDLYNSNLDAIVCSGPPQLHQNVALEFSKKRIPTFIEKPISTHLNELKKIPLDSLIQIGYNLRFSESINVLKNLKLNNPNLTFKIEYHTNKPHQILWDCSSIIESYLLAVGVHPLSLIQYLVGNIKNTKIITKKIEDSKIDIQMQIEEENNLRSFITMSNTSSKFRLEITVFEKGEPIYHMPDMFKIISLKNQNDSNVIYQMSTLRPVNLCSGYYQQFLSFFSSVKIKEYNNFKDIQKSLWIYQTIESIINE
ncbi:MAG TPA: Gfo/Idh/MocA family oxidoreductase [Pseudobdellovibrionaceae bacterium]|nr:Gfo/Idh/MocA family oxidoreductase [Pseudobdellovibrionaceae bacterium]